MYSWYNGKNIGFVCVKLWVRISVSSNVCHCVIIVILDVQCFLSGVRTLVYIFIEFLSSSDRVNNQSVRFSLDYRLHGAFGCLHVMPCMCTYIPCISVFNVVFISYVKYVVLLCFYQLRMS